MEQLLSAFRMFLHTRDTTFTSRIAEMLQSNGVKVLTSELYPSDPDVECRHFFSGTLLKSGPGIVRRLIEAGKGGDWEEARLQEVVSLAEKEMQEAKAFVRWEMWCHVGRKHAREV